MKFQVGDIVQYYYEPRDQLWYGCVTKTNMSELPRGAEVKWIKNMDSNENITYLEDTYGDIRSKIDAEALRNVKLFHREYDNPKLMVEFLLASIPGEISKGG